MASPVTREASCRHDFEKCNKVETTQAAITIANTMAVTAAIGSLVSQGSENDVRIFQLVQECQLNGSPACPSVLKVDRHSDVTEDSLEEPPEYRVVGSAPAPNSGDGDAPGNQKAAEDAVEVTWPCHDAPSPRKTAHGACAENAPPSRPAYESQTRDWCLSQHKCHSRATVQNSQGSGQPSPTHAAETVSRCADSTCRVRTANHSSEIFTVVETQSGSGAGTGSLVCGGDGLHRDAQQWELAQLDPSSHALELQALPTTELDANHALDTAKHRSALADVPACKPDSGAGGIQTVSDHPAGMKPPSPQLHVCDHSLLHSQAPSDKHDGVACAEHDVQDDDLDNFLPTQIDGLENLMFGAELAVAGPAKQSHGEAPLAEGDACDRESPGSAGISEQPVGDSCATLSCIVPDSDDGKATGTSCPLSLPAPAHSEVPKQAPVSPAANPQAQPLNESDGQQQEIEEAATETGVADQEPEPNQTSHKPTSQTAPVSPQLDRLIDSSGAEDHGRTEGHTDVSLEGPALATGNNQGWQKDAEMSKHVVNIGELAAAKPWDAGPVPEGSHQQSDKENPRAPQETIPSAAQDDSENDGTVCDSEDAAIGDAAAVESALAPCQKQADEMGKHCMSDTIQDTRTQGKKVDESVPESQQTVRQQPTPATPLLMQQRPDNQNKTPDLFQGPCVSGKPAVSKLTKSRGGAIVAAVKDQLDKSTATGGDPQAVLPANGTSMKAPRSPPPAAPLTTGQVTPQPRSRGDRVHSKRVARAQHDARIHKAAIAAAHKWEAVAGTSHGGAASTCANPRSRSPSPLPTSRSRTPPETSPAPAARNAVDNQRTPSPLPKSAVYLHRSDLGPANGVKYSPGAKACNSIPACNSSLQPSNTNHRLSPHLQVAPVSDRHADKVPHSKTKVPTEGAEKGPGSSGAGHMQQVSGRKRERDASMPMHDSSPSHRPNSHATCRDALHNAAKNAALHAEPAINGQGHAGSTCLMTDSQLSLQNWIETPREGAKNATTKKSPPRFPKSPLHKHAAAMTTATAAQDSDDDFEPVQHSSLGIAVHNRMPVSETQREEIEWSEFQQRRSGGKPSHVLDSQNATAFLDELLRGAAEEDIPLIDRAKRRLPQAVGRRVKHHPAAPRPDSGESAGPQASLSLKIPRIAVASQQGSQDVPSAADSGPNHTRTKLARHSAPAATKSPVPVRHIEDGRAAVKAEKKSPYSGPNRSAQAVPRSSPGGKRPAAANKAKSPLRDTGSIPFGAHASAHKWAQDGDGDFKCTADPSCSADRSPRRSARIARHNIVPAADADKALANISQVCRLTQDTSEDPGCSDGRTRKLTLHQICDDGNGETKDKAARGNAPQQHKCKLESNLARSTPRGPGDRHQGGCRAHVQRPRTSRGKPELAKGHQTESPSPLRGAVTPERSVAQPHGHKAQKSPLHRKTHTSAGGAATPAAGKEDKLPVLPTPSRSPIIASAKVAQQAGSAQLRTDMQWLEPPAQNTCWKVFYSGLHSSHTGHIYSGDVVGIDTPQCQIMLQVKKMWQNICTEEMCVSGVRLYQILDTPVHAFAPSGVDKKRCLALSEDMYTFARDQVAHKLSVVFVGEGKDFTNEAEALRVLERNPSAFVCRLAVQDSGGAVPLQS